MRQALHIFRKDAYRARSEIVLLLALTAAFACSNIFRGTSILALVARCLPWIWWLPICLLIQEESLVGDRQFWITRPYSRASLLAAKALFIVTFINVPLLFAQFAILIAAGFQPLAYLPSFLWVHIVFFASVLLPAVALSSVTRNLGQAVLVFFGITAALIVIGLAIGGWAEQTSYGPYPFRWAGNVIEEASFAAVALLILILQWTTRMRWLALAAGVGFYLLFSLFSGNLPTTLGIAVESRMFGERGADQTAVTIDGSSVGWVSAPAERQSVLISVGFHVVNLPEGLMAQPGIMELTFDDGRGARWSSGWIPVMPNTFQPDPDRTFAWSQNIWLDRQFARRVGSSPLTVHGSVWLMLNARRVMNLPDNRRTLVPGGGACTVHNAHNARFLDCASPFHDTFSATNGFAFWDSPVPETFSLSPLSWFSTPAGRLGNFACVSYQPRAYIHRCFTATNVRLP
jgi:hypothetical protein